MVLERGEVDCKMYLMTSLEMILFYSIHVMLNPISISASQPEPRCHIDLRFQLSHSWGRGCTSARTKMSHWPQIYTFPFLGWGRGGGWNLRSMWHFSSGWCTPGYIRSHSNFLQVFQSWNEMLIFGLCSTSDDQPGWSMDLNPICHPSPAKKVKCSFLDYIQLLMISRAIPAMKVNQNVTKGPLSHQKMKYLFL